MWFLPVLHYVYCTPKQMFLWWNNNITEKTCFNTDHDLKFKSQTRELPILWIILKLQDLFSFYVLRHKFRLDTYVEMCYKCTKAWQCVIFTQNIVSQINNTNCNLRKKSNVLLVIYFILTTKTIILFAVSPWLVVSQELNCVLLVGVLL